MAQITAALEARVPWSTHAMLAIAKIAAFIAHKLRLPLSVSRQDAITEWLARRIASSIKVSARSA